MHKRLTHGFILCFFSSWFFLDHFDFPYLRIRMAICHSWFPSSRRRFILSLFLFLWFYYRFRLFSEWELISLSDLFRVSRTSFNVGEESRCCGAGILALPAILEKSHSDWSMLAIDSGISLYNIVLVWAALDLCSSQRFQFGYAWLLLDLLSFRCWWFLLLTLG